MKIDALIISAGYSRRMADFKPLLKFEGIPFILAIILKLYRHCGKIHVVIGYRAEDIQNALNDWFHRQPTEILQQTFRISKDEWNLLRETVHCIYHPKYDQGMFSSFQAGLLYCKNSDWIIYHFVDQPHLPGSFYDGLTKQLSADYNWIQPRYQQRKGHPILIHKSLFPLILKEDPSHSLAEVSRNPLIKSKFWDCTYPQILQDFNFPDDIPSGE